MRGPGFDSMSQVIQLGTRFFLSSQVFLLEIEVCYPGSARGAKRLDLIIIDRTAPRGPSGRRSYHAGSAEPIRIATAPLMSRICTAYAGVTAETEEIFLKSTALRAPDPAASSQPLTGEHGIDGSFMRYSSENKKGFVAMIAGQTVWSTPFCH